MRFRRFRTIGKAEILKALQNGAELSYVSGRYGGWSISLPYTTVRADSCYKLEQAGLLKVKERRLGCVVYTV